MAKPDPFEPKQLDADTLPDGKKRPVHLPSLISDEFGVSRSQARMNLAMATVVLRDADGNDEELSGNDRFDVPYAKIVDKEIIIAGDVQSYRLKYRG